MPNVLLHKASNYYNIIVSRRAVEIRTRRMAIANGTCVSFYNQPKAHYLALRRVADMSLPSAVLRVEAFDVKRVEGTFGLPWVRPWDNRGKCYIHGNWKEDSMLIKRIEACTHLSSTVSQ